MWNQLHPPGTVTGCQSWALSMGSISRSSASCNRLGLGLATPSKNGSTGPTPNSGEPESGAPSSHMADATVLPGGRQLHTHADKGWSAVVSLLQTPPFIVPDRPSYRGTFAINSTIRSRFAGDSFLDTKASTHFRALSGSPSSADSRAIGTSGWTAFICSATTSPFISRM